VKRLPAGLLILALLAVPSWPTLAVETPEQWLQEGNRQMTLGDYDQAIRAYRQVIARNHDPARVAVARRWVANACLKKGQELLQRGQAEHALALFNQALRARPPLEVERLVEAQRREAIRLVHGRPAERLRHGWGALPAFGGIGIEIEVQESRPVILRVSREGPAARAGLRTGDVILSVDGKDTAAMSIREVVRAIRGRAGTRVALGLRRGDEKPFQVDLVRAPLPGYGDPPPLHPYP
jgi:tetratricopeptide (TPR) repeat protein